MHSTISYVYPILVGVPVSARLPGMNALISEGVYYVATFVVVMMILAQLFGSATAQAVVSGIGIVLATRFSLMWLPCSTL